MISDKQFLTVAEVSRVFSISLQTVYRHCKKGKLSRHSDGLISLSECLRVYGAIPTSNQHDEHVKQEFSESGKHVSHETLTALNLLITQLQTDLAQSLKREQDYLEREKRLMTLLEHQTGAVAPAEKSGGLFGRLFK